MKIWLCIGIIVPGIASVDIVKKTQMETGPRKTGLTIKACFCVFRLCKKAANSNKHHNRCVHVGSQRINIWSELFKSPAKLKMAWAFNSLSAWLMQIRSKKTYVCGCQNMATKQVTRTPEQSDQVDQLTSTPSNRKPRWKPGSCLKMKSSIISTPVSKPKDTAAVPL